MTNCLEGIFAFLKIAFIPKGKRVLSEGKIYICIYMYLYTHTHTHTQTHIDKYIFFLPKIQVLLNSFYFMGGTQRTGLNLVLYRGGFEVGKGAFW